MTGFARANAKASKAPSQAVSGDKETLLSTSVSDYVGTSPWGCIGESQSCVALIQYHTVSKKPWGVLDIRSAAIPKFPRISVPGV